MGVLGMDDFLSARYMGVLGMDDFLSAGFFLLRSTQLE
jgi:hypothetical protein